MKIHYCWFGKNPKSPLVLECIESWRKFCPDAELIEWNEGNFDFHIARYVKEAYDLKKWAFVSDYCRFFVLYHYGGIYLDTDVELLRSLSGLPNNFVGFEDENYIASGLIRAAPQGDWFCKLMLDDYDKDRFVLPEGGLNLRTVCQRETALLCKYGLKLNNQIQEVSGIHVYPSDFFCPLDYRTRKLTITENTYSIHYYSASWYEKNNENLISLEKKAYKMLPKMLATPVVKFIHSVYSQGALITAKKVLKKLFNSR